MYRKEIIYMGLHKNGNRLGSAGFLKVENKDTQSRLFLKLQNIPHHISGRFPIRIYSGADWKEVDGVTVREGSGVWEESTSDTADNIRLQIMLPEGYLIEGQGKTAEQKAETYQEQTTERRTIEGKAAEAEEKSAIIQDQDRYRDAVKEYKTEKPQEPEIVRVVPTCQESDKETEISNKKISRDSAEAWKQTRMEAQSETDQRVRDKQRAVIAKPTESVRTELADLEMPQPCSVKEDKWEQILSSYEQIHPYGDERVYVKLEPKDFIILQSKYQHLVNNSFLLHGFYNYRYVILGKEEDYYLGVPGVFYEREKMVALMFGFEAFECPGGIAKPGEFGYYLRKVEL